MAQKYYPEKVDVSNCEKEPIHIIGKSQSHGVIVACHKDSFIITQIGLNSAHFFGRDHDEYLGKPLSHLVGEDLQGKIAGALDSADYLEVHEFSLNGKNFVIIPHLSNDSLVIDFEEINEQYENFNFQKQLSTILKTLSSSEDAIDLCRNAARITKSIFGYDRVMIYRFDEEWNGEVVAEEKEENLESWLGLHYPASDIPKQSRALFLKNRVRIIANVNYDPVPIVPELDPDTGNPLDLSKSELRGVSPIHIEYLQNMRVGASLTAALVNNGKLWGLIACHHYSAKFINYYQRQTCDFITQIFSNELSLKESNSFLKEIAFSGEIRETLMNQIQAIGNIHKGLTKAEVLFTDLINSGGGAIILNNKITIIGAGPSEKQIKSLIKNFLSKREENFFYHKNLTQFFPEAKKYQDVASGVLCARLGQSRKDYLIWFRPEVIQTVNWGGNPQNKAFYDEEKQRLTPRKSFEKWSEELRGVSNSWKEYEVNAAKSLRESVSYLILDRQKQKIKKLNKEIIKAHEELELFSQGLSHDLKAPLRGIDGYAYILKEDYYHKVGREGQLAIDTILSSTAEMNELIDNILSFSGLNAQNLEKSLVNANHLVNDLVSSFNISKNYPKTRVVIQEHLPKMLGDKRMINQIWSNLLENALKYSEREEHSKVEVGSIIRDNKTVYFVKDNGIGFDPKYKDDIFELFSRFSGGNFKGTGVGLAISKKIIEKHNGEIWAESELGAGTTFYFHL